MEFVSETYFILVAVLWVLGKILKGTPKVKDWTIPLILLAVGIVGCVALAVATTIESTLPKVIIDAVIQGVIVAGLAVFAHEVIKQVTVKRHDDDISF